MRFVLLLALPAAMLAACKKSALVTAPGLADSVSVAGAWSGCIVEPPVTCSPISMTLSDSALTDTTANVTGSGSWGDAVAIKGKRVNANVVLDANATGVIQGWSFVGVVSNDSLTGTMTTPGNATAYQAGFSRSP
jgi:hypothetical protein